MTEEVKVRSFSELTQDNGWVKPENMYVIKSKGIDWEQYWNEETRSMGGLINATIYYEKPTELAEGWEIVDYKEITGTK